MKRSRSIESTVPPFRCCIVKVDNCIEKRTSNQRMQRISWGYIVKLYFNVAGLLWKVYRGIAALLCKVAVNIDLPLTYQ